MKIKIEIPTTCPSCNSTLEQVNNQLFCRLDTCTAQNTKTLLAFTKKMKIKGLGPSTISKLGFVRPIEIYETDEDTYMEVLGEKIGQKIFAEVQNSRVTTFDNFLAALSIPLIGSTLSKKLAEQVNNIDELVHAVTGLNIGPKAYENLNKWGDNNYNETIDLESYFTYTERNIIPLEDLGTVCITGKLKDFSNRTKAKDYLENLGYKVTTSISKNTDFLVCEDGSSSSKSKKAESLGIPIVSIMNLTQEI